MPNISSTNITCPPPPLPTPPPQKLMLFVFINVYCCPTEFLYKMIFVSLNNNTTDATIGAATVYLSGALDHKYLLTFKCIKKEAPSYLSNKLSYVSETNPYAVRNAMNGNLNAPKPKTELFKKTYAYSSPFLWNCLQTSVRKSNNTNVFKTNIKHINIFDSSNHQGSV